MGKLKCRLGAVIEARDVKWITLSVSCISLYAVSQQILYCYSSTALCWSLAAF
jgi:hypothetical protein